MSRTNSTVRVAWLAGLVALIVAVIATTAIASAQRSSYHRQLRQANNAAHFYGVIAGIEEPGTGVADQLALDLKQVPDNKLRFFRGSSNSYGSITSIVGFDPFDDSCGHECGPLTPDTMKFVLLAKDQHTQYHPHPTRHVVSTTLPRFMLAVWLLLGLAMFALPLMRRMQHERSIEHSYPDEWRLVTRMTRALDSGALSNRDAEELRRLRDGLSSALQLRMATSGTEDVVTGQRVDKLKEEARAQLAAFEEGNRALES